MATTYCIFRRLFTTSVREREKIVWVRDNMGNQAIKQSPYTSGYGKTFVQPHIPLLQGQRIFHWRGRRGGAQPLQLGRAMSTVIYYHPTCIACSYLLACFHCTSVFQLCIIYKTLAVGWGCYTSRENTHKMQVLYSLPQNGLLPPPRTGGGPCLVGPIRH